MVAEVVLGRRPFPPPFGPRSGGSLRYPRTLRSTCSLTA